MSALIYLLFFYLIGAGVALVWYVPIALGVDGYRRKVAYLLLSCVFAALWPFLALVLLYASVVLRR